MANSIIKKEGYQEAMINKIEKAPKGAEKRKQGKPSVFLCFYIESVLINLFKGVLLCQ